ncbi:MAG: UDP-N-acetylglucosamine 1-carboxyvinyltransferase [Pseudopedobacter sp.]|nr:UDP-N-acetylglucosamine 1-carboxyvinyltransferase [Deinococcales bacterium]
MQLTPLRILGGTPLAGSIRVQSSKNAALPIIVSSLLTCQPVTLYGVPRLSDIFNLLEIMGSLGTHFTWLGEHTLLLHTPELASTEAPFELVSKMRASFSILGALLSRAGVATVGMPGGCAWGDRPVDQHIKAMKAFGFEISELEGSFHAIRTHAPRGTYVFEMLTVGATQNAILSSVLGGGNVTLENASIDTDVVDMANFLNSLGANIRGAGTHTITVQGVEALSGGEYEIIPDRIEAGTMMIAVAATRGCVTFSGVRLEHLRALVGKLTEMGVNILDNGNTVMVDARGTKLHAVDLTTSEYPGFPTDLQPQMCALLSTVEGTAVVVDKIYSDRRSHVNEMRRMGASIEVHDHVQVIRGGSLRGTTARAADIRAGGALVIAALAAEGTSTIEGMQYINRGYENLAARLRSLGANVEQLEPELAMAVD